MIDNHGTIRVAQNTVLDYETRSKITLRVIATNVIGDSRSKELVINLNNLAEEAAILKDLDLSINKETVVGTTIGNIFQYTGDSAISSIVLSQSSWFEVSLNGDVKVSRSLLKQTDDSFTLSVKAINTFGESNNASINISLVTTPLIDDLFMNLYDNTVENTQIAKISIVKNGNTIESIVLSGEGSEDFQVDLNGIIRVNQGVSLKDSKQEYYSLVVRVNTLYEASLSINLFQRIIGSVDTPGEALSVTLSSDGTIAYIADRISGLQIIDIREATQPVIIGSVDTPREAWRVTLSTDGTKAYILDIDLGLQIVDISDPTQPVIIGSIDTPGDAWSVTLSTDGTKAYIADTMAGLLIVDISDF